MITYPTFAEAVAELDLDELALASGVPTSTIRAIIAGGLALSLGERFRLATALHANAADLFVTASVLEHGTVVADLEPAYPANRFVTDPATHRQIDRPRPAA